MTGVQTCALPIYTRKLGGFLAYHLKVGVMLLVAGLAMAGIPPLSGFPI